MPAAADEDVTNGIAAALLADRRARPILRGMRRLATLFLALAPLAFGPPAVADQEDPRLDGLFEELREANDPINARGTENAIWQLWIETDDPGAAKAMAAGIAALDARDFEGALAIYDGLVAQAPDYAEAWNKRATTHYLLGNYERSLADIERTLALEPRHFGALAGRGMVQLERGDPLAAIEAFEAALEINPNLVGVRHNLQVLKSRQQPI